MLTGRFFCSCVLDQIVIAHLVRILRNRTLVFYAGSLRDNRTNLRNNVLRLASQNLAIFLGNGIYLATDISKSLCTVTWIVNVLGKYTKKNIISQSSLKIVHETDTY